MSLICFLFPFFFLLIVWIAYDSYDSLDSCPLFVPSLEQDTPVIIIFGIHHTFMQVSTSLSTYPTTKKFVQTFFLEKV